MLEGTKRAISVVMGSFCCCGVRREKFGSPVAVPEHSRAHGKGEPNVLRLPFGCEVIFVPQDTKSLSQGKWEGSGEGGVLAGYGLQGRRITLHSATDWPRRPTRSSGLHVFHLTNDF